jgi:methylmalonyl-CoA mutase cobalamin-binding subunit
MAQTTQAARPQDRGSRDVDALAGRALHLVARGGDGREPGPQPDAEGRDLLHRLVAAVCEADPGHRDAIMAEMSAAGISPDEIIDSYIPEAARLLGEAWCEDRASFTDVTIGVARLQGLLRELGDRRGDALSDARGSFDSPRIMVIVRQDSFHTLGALVAGAQLRRMGLSVRMVIGESDSEITMLARTRDFDMIMLSAAGCEDLALLGKLVKKIRVACSEATPIVLGGPILEAGPIAKTSIGVDFTTNDPCEALRLCGLKVPQAAAVVEAHAQGSF